MMRLIEKFVSVRRAQDDVILRAFDPWTLACGAAAENGSLGTAVPFRSWLRQSRPNWMPAVRYKAGVSERRILKALWRYVERNAHSHYEDILHREEARRGMPLSRVVGRGIRPATMSVRNGAGDLIEVSVLA